MRRGAENAPWGEPQELDYPIQANVGGLVPNFTDDVSSVQAVGFVAATSDVSDETDNESLIRARSQVKFFHQQVNSFSPCLDSSV